jgi:hypothetical protein
MSMSLASLALGLPPLPSPSSGSPSSTGKRRPYTRHSIPAAAMPEYRHVRSGSLNIPNGAASNSPSSLMPRSPPSRCPICGCEQNRASFNPSVVPLALHPRVPPPPPHHHPQAECQICLNLIIPSAPWGQRRTQDLFANPSISRFLQTPLMSRASSSDKAPARPAMPVPLVTISEPRRRTSASTLPRYVACI